MKIFRMHRHETVRKNDFMHKSMKSSAFLYEHDDL